jgi:hypothetical protein
MMANDSSTFANEGEAELRKQIDEAQELLRRFAEKQIFVTDLASFLAQSIPPRKFILEPIIAEQSLTMIYSWRGVGKTHVALGLAYASSSGGQFLRWKAPAPRKVLYIDGEMPAAQMQERLAAIVKGSDLEPPDGFFRLITPDLQRGPMPDLATSKGQQLIDSIVEQDTSLIILDNLSALVRRGGKENESESWLNVQDWALRHRAERRSVLYIHHAGKGLQQRGTSRREDLLDTVITLRQPTNYNASSGAIFEVRFEKSRGLYGDDTKPFEAKLTLNKDGKQTWATREIEETTLDRVVELYGLGLSQKDMADELGVNKSSVSRAMKRAKELGLIVIKGDRE